MAERRGARDSYLELCVVENVDGEVFSPALTMTEKDRKECVRACVLTRIALLWNLFQLPLLGCALLQICLPTPKCPGLDLPPSSSHCTQLPLELSLPCRWHLSLPRDSAAPSLSPRVHPLLPTPQEGHLRPALGLQQVLPCPSGIRV